jgi:hypothetical protein
LGERFRLLGQSAVSALWKSRIKCTENATMPGR